MRDMRDITEQELEEINKIVGSVSDGWFDSSHHIKYCLFEKTRAVYSGEVVLKVYFYLKSIGIDWLATEEEELHN